MKIKILGTGCPNCQKLKNNVDQAVLELGRKDIEIEKIEDIEQIISLGVISTPALIIKDDVKSSGRIPNIEEIKSWL